MRGVIKEILTLLKVIRRRLIGMGLGAACWGGGGGTWWLPRAPKCCELQLPLLVLASHLGLALFFASFYFFFHFITYLKTVSMSLSSLSSSSLGMDRVCHIFARHRCFSDASQPDRQHPELCTAIQPPGTGCSFPSCAVSCSWL